MKRIIKFFTVNPALKLMALLASITIWFFCMNFIDPVEKLPFPVTLSLVNLDALKSSDKELINEKQLESKIIYITIEGPKSELDALDKNRQKLSAYVDFKVTEILNATQVLDPIKTFVQSDLPPELLEKKLTIFEISPRTVDISLDTIISQQFTIRNVSGSVADGYVIQSADIFPTQVTIKGPSLSLAKIGSVRADISLDNISESINQTAGIKLYTVDDTEFTDSVTLSTNYVLVSVAVSKLGTLAINRPTTIGSLPDGYAITGMDYTPKSIEIVGTKENVSAAKSISLDPIDISEFTETTTVTIDLRSYVYETNLNLSYNSEYQAEVTFFIEKVVDIDIEVPYDELEIRGGEDGMEIELSGDPVTIIARGLASVIDVFDRKEISGYIDITGLEPGEHEVQVMFIAPSGITVVSEDVFVTVSITLMETDDGSADFGDGEPGDEPEI